EHVPLSELARELEQCTGARPPPYRRLYEFVLSGDLPAARHKNRWFIHHNDVKLIAIMLEMLTLDGRKAPGNEAVVRPRDWRPSITIAQARAASSNRKRAGSESRTAPV